MRSHGKIALPAQHAAEHPPHVAIHDGDALTKAEGRNGRRRRWPDARQLLQGNRVDMEAASVRVPNHLGKTVQVACSAVVAKPTPEGQHLVELRIGQRHHRRKPRQEALVVTQDRADLRLLQHDLRQPNAVRVARLLPRQVVPALRALPGHEAIRQVGVQSFGPAHQGGRVRFHHSSSKQATARLRLSLQQPAHHSPAPG